MTTLRYILSQLSIVCCSEEMIVDFFFFPSPKLSLSQVPLVAACSPSGISEVDVNQIEGAVQDLNLTSPTEPADFGNQI